MLHKWEMLLVFCWGFRSTVGFMFKLVSLTVRKVNWSVGSCVPCSSGAGGSLGLTLLLPPEPSSCESHPAITPVCFSSSPPWTAQLLLLVQVCLVLSAGLNHAKDTKNASRPGPAWAEELEPSFECDIKVCNETLQAPSQKAKHGAMFMGFWAVALVEC